MRAYERMLKYVVVRTPSLENQDCVPSTACQFDLAKILVEELKELGVENAFVDDKCYVYGSLPATPGYEDRTKLGLSAHIDTIWDFRDKPVVPRVIENFDGQDFTLGDSGLVLSAKDFPMLPSLKGRTLICTDGNTELGADDKAGIAEIMTVLERVQKENIPHGPIHVAFTPDEEIGLGPANFSVEKFGAEIAYTLDGGREGQVQYECFNACKALFDIKGVNVHPGASKDIMINAGLIAMEINDMLPTQTPRNTEGYEGFFHLMSMDSEVSHAHMYYTVRDFDKASFNCRKATLRHIEKVLNEKWGEGTVTLTLVDQYPNMADVIAGCMHMIDNAKEACRRAGVEPIIEPVRGGTDGAQYCYMGLPCPNLGTGGYGFHGPYEHITAEGMDIMTDIALELVKIYADRKSEKL